MLIRRDNLSIAINLSKLDPIACYNVSKNPSSFTTVGQAMYESAFKTLLDSYRAINTFKIWRYIDTRLQEESWAAGPGPQRLCYRYGRHVAIWLLLQRVDKSLEKPEIFAKSRIESALGAFLDQLRSDLFDGYNRLTITHWQGPLAFFRNQTNVFDAVIEIAIANYGVGNDPVIGQLRSRLDGTQERRLRLFSYLASKAPQIEI
jgi:hypothetical protein